ncbi:MAG: serine/threonine-protein kinase [Candidatus Margulisiibacteriota bacterium]
MEQLLKSRYTIGEKISENNFSVTYRGTYVGTDKPLIVKIYKRGTLNSSLIKGMKFSVKDFSLISHSSVAKMIDGDYGWQGFYYIREYINGKSLRQVLADGKMETEQALMIAQQVLAALEATEAKGVLYGALTPENIIINDKGEAKITDFVIKGEVKEALPQKIQELLVGLPYASPESLEGAPLTPASDLYSFGMIFFEMLAGRPLIKNGGIAAHLQKMKRASLVNRPELAFLPGYLADILFKLLQRDPILRFQSAAVVRESLASQSLPLPPKIGDEYLKLFEGVVTQYGGEDPSQSQPAKPSGETKEQGEPALMIPDKKESRSWLFAIIIFMSVAIGVVYAFYLGK